MSEVEQHCRVQLTLADAQAAQLRQEKAAEEAATVKRIDGEWGLVCYQCGLSPVFKFDLV